MSSKIIEPHASGSTGNVSYYESQVRELYGNPYQSPIYTSNVSNVQGSNFYPRP